MPMHFDRFRLLNDSDQDIDDVEVNGTQPPGGTTLPTKLGRIGAGCGPRVFKGIKAPPGGTGQSTHATLRANPGSGLRH